MCLHVLAPLRPAFDRAVYLQVVTTSYSLFDPLTRLLTCRW
jgi:hypothetical protein